MAGLYQFDAQDDILFTRRTYKLDVKGKKRKESAAA
jgi:hypothetical protein